MDERGIEFKKMENEISVVIAREFDIPVVGNA
jgi:hypothetical protein